MRDDIFYRELRPDEIKEACDLVLNSFNELVAPGYSDEGVKEFLKYVNPEAMSARLAQDHFALAAFENGVITGIMEVRSNNHISLLFVKKEYHRKGIAGELLKLALEKCRQGKNDSGFLEVNSSPYAVHIYEKLGFKKPGPEQIVNGIRFTHMVLKVGK